MVGLKLFSMRRPLRVVPMPKRVIVDPAQKLHDKLVEVAAPLEHTAVEAKNDPENFAPEQKKSEAPLENGSAVSPAASEPADAPSVKPSVGAVVRRVRTLRK